MEEEPLYKIGTIMGNLHDICGRRYSVLLPEATFDTIEASDILLLSKLK